MLFFRARTGRSQRNAIQPTLALQCIQSILWSICRHQLAGSQRVGWSTRCQVTSSVRRHVEPHLVVPECRRRLTETCSGVVVDRTSSSTRPACEGHFQITTSPTWREPIRPRAVVLRCRLSSPKKDRAWDEALCNAPSKTYVQGSSWDMSANRSRGSTPSWKSAAALT